LHIFRLRFDPVVIQRGSSARGPDDGSVQSSAEIVHSVFIDFIREHFSRVRLLPGAYSRRLEEWVRLIRVETERQEAGYSHRIEAFCRLLVTDLAREVLASESTPRPAISASKDVQKSGNWAVQHVKQYLLDHHEQALTLEQIANDVKLSAEHLSRSFKRETGMTVFGHLRQIRVEAAKSLLISSKYTVTEIASRSGFSSVMLFCRVFHAVTGQTPKTFRERAVSGIAFEHSATTPRETTKDHRGHRI
jgi:AraC-like DNA-binding protein